LLVTDVIANDVNVVSVLLLELTSKYPLIELVPVPQLVNVAEKSTEFMSNMSMYIEVIEPGVAELYLNNPVPGSALRVFVSKLYLNPAPSPCNPLVPDVP